MDKHFNLFQSYNSGNDKDLAGIVQLEDNLTRSLTCTLSNLEIDFLNFEKIREDEDRTKQLRVENLRLLENPDLLIDNFATFIKDTLHIFLAMANEKKSADFKMALENLS